MDVLFCAPPLKTKKKSVKLEADISDAHSSRVMPGRTDTQHNDIQHNDIQHNFTQHNDIQQKGLICDADHKGLYVTLNISDNQHNNALP